MGASGRIADQPTYDTPPNAELLKLAEQRRPPQRWYDEDLTWAELAAIALPGALDDVE